MIKFTVIFVTLLSIISFGYSSPLKLQERADRVQCSEKVVLHTDDLGYGNEVTENYRVPVGQHYSAHGQLQVVDRNNGGVGTLTVNVRACNSSHLGFYNAPLQDNGGFAYTPGMGYSGYGKIFLANDESKCLQRHATLPSSDPSAKTHITIEDCSDVDDSRQARQFFSIDTKYGTLSPLVKPPGGDVKIINLILNRDSPREILATRESGNSFHTLLFSGH